MKTEDTNFTLLAIRKAKTRIAKRTKQNMDELRARVIGVRQRLAVIKSDPSKQDRMPALIRDAKVLNAELEIAIEYYEGTVMQ